MATTTAEKVKYGYWAEWFPEPNSGLRVEVMACGTMADMVLWVATGMMGQMTPLSRELATAAYRKYQRTSPAEMDRADVGRVNNKLTCRLGTLYFGVTAFTPAKWREEFGDD